MKKLLEKLHTRLGDFWWYSLMIFMAARLADCLNVFVGLWLVPKYVPPDELGAVMPLVQFANFLAIPAAVFASTFRNELTDLAIRHEFGKMKTLMRSVFVATAAFFFLAIIICHFLLPQFLIRIRVAEGSLGMLILVASFLGTAAPVFSNALQSLKKFKATSLISLIGAPVRFITMIFMMPFRAISGYFVGQASVPAFSIAASVLALRKELSVPAEPYWTRPAVKHFTKLFLILSIGATIGAFSELIPQTIIRQRLSELDSAAYYMVTRFSDIAGFLYAALFVTIFPFAAELGKNGRSTLPLILKSAVAIFCFNAPLALFFTLFGKTILSLLPNGSLYCDYWWAIPWLIGIVTIQQFTYLYTTSELALCHLKNMWLFSPCALLYACTMLFVTGYGYFTNYLPNWAINFFSAHNIRTLADILMWFTAYQLIRVILCIIDYRWRYGRHNNR